MEKVRLIGLAMAFAAAAALAGPGRYTATLAQPLAKKKEFIANGNAWICDGALCTLRSTPLRADSIVTCRELRREAGAVTAYGVEGMQFTAAQLESCNAPG